MNREWIFTMSLCLFVLTSVFICVIKCLSKMISLVLLSNVSTKKYKENIFLFK